MKTAEEIIEIIEAKRRKSIRLVEMFIAEERACDDLLEEIEEEENENGGDNHDA